MQESQRDHSKEKDAISPWGGQIRPFCEEDRAALVEIDNEGLPSCLAYTSNDGHYKDQKNRQNKESGHTLRLVVSDPIVAYLDVADLTHMPWFSIASPIYVAGVSQIHIAVTQHHRQQGIGTALYEQALAFAQERNAHTLLSHFYQHREEENPPALSFLQKRGFKMHEHRQASYLDLKTFDTQRFSLLMNRASQQRIHFFLFRDLANTVDNWFRLYQLFNSVNARLKWTPFETWLAHIQERVDWTKELLVLAEIDGKWIGANNGVIFNSHTKTMTMTFTGVSPAYRGKGIGMALELYFAHVAQQQGYQMLLTSSLTENAAINTIKQQIGFVLSSRKLTYGKVIDETHRKAWLLSMSRLMR